MRQARNEIERLNQELQQLKEPPSRQPFILKYGVALSSVTLAVVLTLWMRSQLGQGSTPIVAVFLCAVMFSGWFAGLTPGLFAIALSVLAFDYFFATPFYSLALDMREIPRLLVFTVSALFVLSLTLAQRNAAESLRRARDILDETVQGLRRSNEALRKENAERKHAESLLHAKEQEFRAIVENAPDQIIRYDRDFRRVYVNPAVAQAYGLQQGDLMGKPIGSVIEEAGFNIEAAQVAQVRERIASVFETGNTAEFELTWPLVNGERHLSVRLFPELDLNGVVIYVLGITRDITERKQAEEALRQSEDRLRLVINTIPIMTWSVQSDGSVDFANQRWFDYSGLTWEQFTHDPTDLIHQEERTRVVEKWLACMEVGEPYEAEMRLRRADGEYRWFLVRTAPVRDNQGNVIKWYCKPPAITPTSS